MAVARSEFLDPRLLAAALPQLAGSSTLPSRIHEILETAIITGSLKPGERIHADDLAAHYGVSRIPVREALRSLHEAGWVEIRPRYGVRVREHAESELDELFEFRAVVEGRVAAWAAQRRTDDELEELRRTVAANRPGGGRGAGSELALLATTSSFYSVLRRAAHNAVLDDTSTALEKRARFYFSTVANQLGDDWIGVHEQLLDLVDRRRATAAAKVASEHIVHTGAAVRALLFPDRSG